MNTRNFITPGILLLSLIISSCSTVSYYPRISLDMSPATIHKSVMVEKFIDRTPEKDKENPFWGFSVTNDEALASDLSIEVTNAVISDFSTNAVFENISRRTDKPDFIIQGEITKFMGKTRLTTYGLVSLCSILGVYTWILGMPIQKNETEVEILISVYNSNNELVGKYSGRYSDKVLGTLYKQKQLGVLNQTNRSFSYVISRIREQILTDIRKYER